MENNQSAENKKHEMYNKLIDRIDVLKTLQIFIDEVQESSTLSEITYLRIKSALDYLIYEFNLMLELGLKRELVIDDNSAKEIADSAKVAPINNSSVVVKKGIDKEIEFIISFVDNIVESPDKMLNSDEMVDFIQKQVIVNKEIEKMFKA